MQKREKMLKKVSNVDEELELTVLPYKQMVQPQVVGGQLHLIQIQPLLQEF